MAQITARRPHPKPGLFLLQLRAHVNQTSSRRRRWVVPIQMHEMPDIPNPVKITFIKSHPVSNDPLSAGADPIAPGADPIVISTDPIAP